jgi:hypothetical protein
MKMMLSMPSTISSAVSVTSASQASGSRTHSNIAISRGRRTPPSVREAVDEKDRLQQLVGSASSPNQRSKMRSTSPVR